MTNPIENEEYYLSQLEEQLSMLIDGCHSYDEGKFYQSKNLSNNIRTIVKDVPNPRPTTRTKSLLFLLNRKSSMKFYNTGFEVNNPLISINLIGIVNVPLKLPTTNKQTQNIYLPLLNNSKHIDVKWLSFEEWWNSKVIVYKSDNMELDFSRRTMVLTMAEQDGGTHVDAFDEVEINYRDLTTATKSIFSSVDNFGNESPIINFHYALIRQIAHELIISLKKEFSFNIPYTPSNKTNLQGVPESQIKQFGFVSRASGSLSSRTSTPYKSVKGEVFKTPENAAYAKFFF